MITYKEIAKQANVSPSTVSRAFTCPELLKEETVTRIRQIAAELHFVPNANAKTLKNNKSGIFGIVISDIANHFYVRVAEMMSKITSDQELLFYSTFSSEDSEIELKSISSLISSRVDAIFFTPTSDSLSSIPELLIANQVPSLQLYRQKFNNIDSLVIDDEYGAYLATKELINHGHKNIILFDFSLSIPTKRDIGYRKAFQESNLPVNEENIVKFPLIGDFEEQLCEIMDKIKPTAVIPTGNTMTTYLFRYLTSKGLKVKDDVSVVAYDDIDMAQSLNLTVISHPIDEIASRALEIVDNRIKHPKSKIIHDTIKPFIIKRDSIRHL